MKTDKKPIVVPEQLCVDNFLNRLNDDELATFGICLTQLNQRSSCESQQWFNSIKPLFIGSDRMLRKNIREIVSNAIVKRLGNSVTKSDDNK